MGDVGRETVAGGARLRVNSDRQVEFVAVSMQHGNVQRPIQQRSLGTSQHEAPEAGLMGSSMTLGDDQLGKPPSNRFGVGPSE